MHRTNILFIGHGKIGRALECVLQEKPRSTQNIHAWDIDKRASEASLKLAEAVPKADILFLTVPSWALSEVAAEIRQYLRPKAILVCVSKGLDRDGNTIDALLKQLFKAQPFALCFGPMLADELLAGKMGAAAIASKSRRVRDELTQLFKGTRLRTVAVTDVHGTAVCGVLKNVYAMGLGIASALHAGSNFQGQYVERALKEMSHILRLLGGKQTTLETPAGIGDFIATSFSVASRNVQYASLIAQGKNPEFLSEGPISIESLLKRLGGKAKAFPLLNAIHSIICKKGDPKRLLLA